MVNAIVTFMLQFDFYEVMDRKDSGEDLSDVVRDALANDPEAVVEYLDGFNLPEARELKSIIARDLMTWQEISEAVAAADFSEI